MQIIKLWPREVKQLASSHTVNKQPDPRAVVLGGAGEAGFALRRHLTSFETFLVVIIGGLLLGRSG